ncbi:macrophage mannose receptor 1-like [Procambarus clarkii]|uniref:macrophage mannose receptor 1-like n=1 Tax=Procambarus clarkii TaxID=6728 RepID=UPI003743896D
MERMTWPWKFILLATACSGFVLVLEGVERDSNNSDDRDDCPYVHVGDQCLLFVNFQLDTYDVAQALCQGFGGNLVVIKTATQMKAIMDYLYTDGDISNSYWMDGMLDNNTGRFTYASGELVPMGTPFWGATYTLHQPSGDGPCIELYSNDHHYMNDLACDHIHFALCEFPFSSAGEEPKEELQEVACEAPFTAVGDMCLAFLTQEHMSWEDAVLTCRLLGENLAMFDDIEMLRSIYLHIHDQAMESKSFWLAGSDMITEGTWLWTSGSPVPMGSPFWGSSYPVPPFVEPNWNTSLNCLGLQAAGKHYFRAVDCQTLQYPLCMATLSQGSATGNAK